MLRRYGGGGPEGGWREGESVMCRGTVADQIWVVRGLAMVGVVGLESGRGGSDGMVGGCLERGWHLARLRCGDLGVAVALGMGGSLVWGGRFVGHHDMIL